MPEGATQRGAPRIKDVARRAGVSPATVSRVLNNTARVAPPKAAQVHRAIEELGFRPSSLARGLSIGRTGSVGVIAPFFSHAGTLARLEGITDAAGGAGYDVMIFNVASPRQRADAFSKFARRDRVDGLVVASIPVSDEEVAAFARERLPVVLIDVAHTALARVTIDDVAGGRLATEHLLGRGHARIGFVGDLAASPLGFTASERRHEGYAGALAAAGVAADRALVRRGPHGRESARTLARDLLASPERPTAVFAASDTQAAGVLQAAADHNLDVPGELAVIGFDDIDLAEILGLTTVRQPLAEMGANAFALLASELGGEDPDPVEIVHPLSLVQRGTT